MSRKLVLAGLCLVLTAGMARATEKSKRRETGGGWGHFGPFAGLYEFDKLNDKLSAAPFHFNAKFDPVHFMFGGGGIVLADHVTIGGYGFGGEQTIHSDSLHLDLTADYGGGMFEMGFMPVTTPHFLLGAALGIGGSGFILRATSVRGYEPNFDSLLLQGARAWEVTNNRFALAPALNIMIPISWAGIQIKAGYLLTLFDKDWKSGSMTVTSPPILKASGPFAALQIAFGGTDAGRKAKVKVKARPEPEEPPEPPAPPEPDDD